MTITRKKLLSLAQDHAARAASAPGIVSIYLIGSVVSGEPLLGGSADIDLVMIHDDTPLRERELVPLSQDVHLDIAHHPRSSYAHPRALRVDPWLGPAVCQPIFLHDPDHFFEWAQAGARGQYHRPDHVAARARAMLAAARSVAPPSSQNGAHWLHPYLSAALRGANAAALLEGFPAWGRRLCLDLSERAQAIGHPEVYAGFLRLLGFESGRTRDLPAWVSAWARTQADAAATGVHLHPGRQGYFLRGFQALLEAGQAESILWHLLRIWNRSVRAMGAGSDHVPALAAALEALGLSESDRATRAADLESYLDHVEVVIEGWAERNGA